MKMKPQGSNGSDVKRWGKWKGVGAVLLSATCFAGTPVLIKTAYGYQMEPLQVILLQSWLASAILMLFALCFDRSLFRVNVRTFFIIACQGLAGSLGTSILLAYALVDLPASVAILLLYLYPALVLIFNRVVWKKAIGRKEWWALWLTMGGTILASGIISGAGKIAFAGILFGVGSAIAYTSFNVLGEIALRETSPLKILCYTQWVSSVGIGLFLGKEIFVLPWYLAQTWWIGLALAMLAYILPFYLLLIGIKYLGSDKAAIISTFELPMTFLLAALFLAEMPQWQAGIGGMLVLAGIVLLNWRAKKDGEANDKRNE